MRVVLLVILLLANTLAARAESGVEVWDLLLPEDQRALQNGGMPIIDHNAPMVEQKQDQNVSLNQELDGTLIRIPGFVVPLDGDETTVTEFLLVPYFGACLHYPPPPPNQIVYVTSKKGVSADSLWDPIWVEGTINTKVQDIDGEFLSGYSIDEPSAISPFEY